ncbi:hypothetical protein K438DRAFT_1767502 [Mycena galopus ATCC 62051]|nr:hypothetical protein K438DRAFT_1767502 [Mycena galopus ATCC 62051]
MDIPQLAPFAQEVLLNAFRTHYQLFQYAVSDLVGSHNDVIVIERLGDDIDEFANMVAENQAIFPPEEFAILETSLAAMFLRVGRTTVWNALLEYGIAEPQQSPFDEPNALSALVNADPTNDDILDPDHPIPSGDFPAEVEELAASSQLTASFAGPMSDISDDDLDMLLLHLRTHYQLAGLSMLNGMLRRLSHRVAIKQIRQSLLRIDPVQQIFERICLIRWGIVIHGFIDGVRGDQLPQEEEGLSEDKLEVYGIDWQGLCNDNILHSHAQNNSTTEGSSSWVGHTGPPPDLSQVIVQPPVGTLTEEEVTDLYNSFSHLIGSAEDGDVILLWSQALAHVRVLYPDVF